MTQRARVVEHRISTQIGPYTVRYWVEASAEHGGVSREEAQKKIDQKENILKTTWGPELHEHKKLALELCRVVPCANSVEVCDAMGNGTAVHRDWP